MKILYTYERPYDDGADIPVDKVFADTKDTRRTERTDMLEGGGLRDVDTLYLRANSQLGHGQEAKLMRAKVGAIGAPIVLAPLDNAPEVVTAVHWRPTSDQKRRALLLWYSALPTKQVLARIEDIAGR